MASPKRGLGSFSIKLIKNDDKDLWEIYADVPTSHDSFCELYYEVPTQTMALDISRSLTGAFLKQNK